MKKCNLYSMTIKPQLENETTACIKIKEIKLNSYFS